MKVNDFFISGRFEVVLFGLILVVGSTFAVINILKGMKK